MQFFKQDRNKTAWTLKPLEHMELLAAISSGNLRILVAPSGCSIVSMGAILYCILDADEIGPTSVCIIILCQSTCKEDMKTTLWMVQPSEHMKLPLVARLGFTLTSTGNLRVPRFLLQITQLC